jgi:hypothetical protein
MKLPEHFQKDDFFLNEKIILIKNLVLYLSNDIQ